MTCGTSKRTRVRPACVPTVGRPACRDDELEPKVETSICALPLCPRTLLGYYFRRLFFSAFATH